MCDVGCLFFFFFKQKTAYELRISDWSSDVCSSDLVASEEVKIALVVQAALVAGHQPVAAELGGGSLGIAPVLEEHHRVGTAHRDGAGRASRALVAVVVDDGDSVARHRPSPGARLHRHDLGAVGDPEVALGLAVTLVHGDAEGPARPLEHPPTEGSTSTA